MRTSESPGSWAPPCLGTKWDAIAQIGLRGFTGLDGTHPVFDTAAA